VQHLREFVLSLVFREFDYNGDGHISNSELMKLGEARRSTGQKQGTWTEEMNRKLVLKMDEDGDGCINEAEFVYGFNSSLPKRMEEFQLTVRQFLDVARHVRFGDCSKPEVVLATAGKVPTDSVVRVPRLSGTPDKAVSASSAIESSTETNASSLFSRLLSLSRVFKVFDTEDCGELSEEQMMSIGKARCGDRRGEWTKEQNIAMMQRMGTTKTGGVCEDAFVVYFDTILTSDPKQFDILIKQFIEAAQCPQSTQKPDRVHNRTEKETPSTSVSKSRPRALTKQEVRGSPRLRALSKVFKLFDLDGGGDIGEEELMLIGRARRVAGHKSGEWTAAQNRAMMRRMGMHQGGLVGEEAFVIYFDNTLPRDAKQFDLIIDQFMEAAQLCRRTQAGAASRLITRQVKSEPIKTNEEVGVNSESSVRKLALSHVFKLFDLDGSGEIGEEELMMLGTARRAAGHRTGEWTVEQNKVMMRRIGMTDGGSVAEEPFVVYFNKMLSHDPLQFDSIIMQFREAAQLCQKMKQNMKVQADTNDGEFQSPPRGSRTVAKGTSTPSPESKARHFDPLDAKFERRWTDTRDAAQKWTGKVSSQESCRSKIMKES